MLYAETEVRAGIALLDRREPDWRESVNWEHLNMASDTNCVLGQVYGEFGIRHVGLTDHLQASAHGFYRCDNCWAEIPPHELVGCKPDATWLERYELLTETWRVLGPRPV